LAINKSLSDTVYVFVNDKNVALAAQEAARLSERTVHVLPTPDIIAGIAGLFALRSESDVMESAARVQSARVFFAGKDATVGGTTVQRGKAAAISDGTLYGGASLEEAARAVLTAMGANDGGLITVYYGGAQKERDAQRLADELHAAFPQADVEYYYGGQKDTEYWVSLDE
jgi:dihydroxyacetone kinase-like predicted kinase